MNSNAPITHGIIATNTSQLKHVYARQRSGLPHLSSTQHQRHSMSPHQITHNALSHCHGLPHGALPTMAGTVALPASNIGARAGGAFDRRPPEVADRPAGSGVITSLLEPTSPGPTPRTFVTQPPPIWRWTVCGNAREPSATFSDSRRRHRNHLRCSSDDGEAGFPAVKLMSRLNPRDSAS